MADTPEEQSNDQVQAARKHVAEATTAWEVCNLVGTLDLQDRAEFFQRFLDLLSQRPETEREALMERGKEVWRYRMETIRDAVDEKVQKDETKAVTVPSVITDSLMAEMVYRQGHELPIGYLVHYFSKPNDSPAFQTQLEVGKTKYIPPSSQLVKSGTVRLASGVEEYGSDLEFHRKIVQHLDSLFYVPDSKRGILDIAASYILMTWVADKFSALPYFHVSGDLGTGKTTVIKAVGDLCYRATFAGGALTSAVLYRVIEEFKGTLVIDEADFERSELWSEIVKILNLGYSRGFPILRMERDEYRGFVVTSFDAFGPKILASRERFPDPALESRCLTYTTELLGDVPERIPLALDPEAQRRAAQLRNKLLLWRFRNHQAITVDPRKRIPGLEPRIQQVLQPLLACAQDQALRTLLLQRAYELDVAMRQERRESLQARILEALTTQIPNAQVVGHWTVQAVTDDLNRGVPVHRHFGERTVGRKLTELGFKRVRGRDNTAAYEFNEALLRDRRLAYGFRPIRTPLLPPSPETPETP